MAVIPVCDTADMSRVEWTRYSGEDVEMVIAVMLLRERPRGAHMRPSQGDGGIDVLTPQPGGPPIVDQIKSFASGALTSSHKRQITESLGRARRELSDQMSEWNLVLPMDHTREQRRWFDGLETPFTKNWRGLTYLEGLVARYPDVVDYYLHGGRGRVEQHAVDLLRLSDLQFAVATGRGVDVVQVSKSLAAASAAVNRGDPHYRYEYRVGASPPGSPQNQDGWVFSQTTGLLDGAYVTIDIFARFDQATELRPIPMNVTLRAQSANDQAAIEEHFNYGTEIDITADVQLPEGLPGGLPNPSGPARIRIVQHQPADRPDIELRILDEHDSVLSILPVSITSSTRGRSGIRFTATDGSQAVEVEGRTNNDTQRASFNYSVQLGRLEGRPVRACLDVVRFSTMLREPNRLALAFRHSGSFATSEPILGGVFADGQAVLLSLLEDLSTIQDRCAVPLLWDSDEAAEDQGDIQLCASLLRGESIEGTWTDLRADMLPDGRSIIEAIKEPSAVVFEREIRFEVFGQSLAIGTERLVFDAAEPTIGAERPDGSFDVTFTPAGSSRYVRSLLSG